MGGTPKKTITICSSGSFYQKALEVEKELRALGYKVKVPFTARKMQKSGNFDISAYKTWYKNPRTFRRKAYLMRNHFQKIEQADAILVLNLTKRGVKNYIGGNVLMEMALAVYLRKPIFVLNKVRKDSPFYEEIYGMRPAVINGDLERIAL